MPRNSRKSSYQLRHHSINPLLTYEGIEKNPLVYIDEDQNSFLVLAELFVDHWKIDEENEKIYLDQVYRFTDEEDQILVKDRLHPLAPFYELVQNEQISIHYSKISTKLTVVYRWNSTTNREKAHLNFFYFYHQCQLNEKCQNYFSRVFTFDEYHSICQRKSDETTDAVNIIDYIYREIEASTMIINHHDDKILRVEQFLKTDQITLKKHQIQSIDWMLKRENSSSIVYSPFHRCHDLFDRIFHVHIINGTPIDLSDEKFPSDGTCLSLSGGILCDEMGLGKTICVLLTSILNPCPTNFFSTEIDEISSTKRMKFDPSECLSCVCGNIVKTSDKNRNDSSKTFFVCHQCSRAVHKKCFLQLESLIDPFLCPYCHQRLTTNESLLSTKTTLIVAPAAIIHQWFEEIDKHLDCSLKVYMYEGVVNKFPVPSREFLASQDFLFCSYENLKKDIHHNEICSTEHYSTRTLQRKYEYLVSPLLRLKFWRLVLDEAQMVDSPNTPTSKMARSLVAEHRWFVTGTPFHRSINDLEGILQYLFPLNNTPRDQIYSLLRIKEKLHHVFLSWLMNFLLLVSRRTSRECLNDLPDQHERVIRLEFSQLERMYYNRVWQECRDDFKREFEYLWQKHQQKQNLGENYSEWTFESTDDIDMNDVHFLSSTARSCLQTPLMKLRCLCDHPQVGAHGVRHNDPALVHYYNRFHYSSNQRLSIKRPVDLNTPMMKDDQPFTMKDLLDLLTARELESGEESLRLALLKYNGLASIYLIQHQHKQTRPLIENNNENYLQLAIETYEKVIELAQFYRKDFHIDSFQLAHAFYNLSYALSLIEKNSPPTFLSQWTEKDAMQEFNQIKERYQTQSINDMNQSWTNFNEKIISKKDLQNDVKELLKNLAEAIKPIENEPIEIFSYLNRDQTLPFKNWKGFLYHLVQQFDQLKEIRELLLLSIEGLERQPTDQHVCEMASCAKCGFDNDPKNLNSCIFCEIEPTMQKYNCSLQPELYSEKQIHDDGGIQLVFFINEILTKASIRSNDSLRQMGKLLRTDWNELLKKLRLENSLARSYAQQLKHFYLDLDEMLQCTSRLELYVGDVQHRPRNKHNRFRFYPQTIDDERRDFLQEAKNDYRQAEKHRQQLHFFQEQQIDYYRSIGDPNLLASDRTKCPMCHEYFGDDRPNVCFFLCGHFFCQQCTQGWKEHEIQQRAHRSHLKCPICRREIPIHSLTVLPWRNKDSAPPEKPSQDHSQNETSVTVSSRLRRLMDKQEHLSVQGHYGTKADSIVSFILELLNQDVPTSNMDAASATTTTTTCSFRPPVKILVFSQFTDILNVLATSLKLNSISHLQFTSTKILQQFRHDPTVTVLLMALGKGANGLNLTEAQHVILVEPQLHRSVELQAIARVRRLGQQHETFVYRFIINDTAEEVVLSNSRTAQTRITHSMSTDGHPLTSDNASISTRAASFADDELLYEIDMARKIFYRARISDDRANVSLFDS